MRSFFGGVWGGRGRISRVSRLAYARRRPVKFTESSVSLLVLRNLAHVARPEFVRDVPRSLDPNDHLSL